MPPPETFERNDYAVVWYKIGDGVTGEPILTTPLELEVRWERTKRDIRGPDGSMITLDGVLVLDRQIPVGSLAYIGTMEEWQGVGSGSTTTQLAELYRVESYDEVPDVKGREVRKEAGLKRFRGVLP